MATSWKDNGDGTIQLIRDDGYQTTLIDPDGSFRKELDANSSNVTHSGNAVVGGQVAGGVSTDSSGNPVVQQPEQPVPGGFAPMAAPPANLAQNPVVNSQVAAEQQALAEAGGPGLRITVPPSPGASVTTTTGPSSSSTRQVTDKDPTGELAKKQAGVIDARQEAIDADAESRRKNIEIQAAADAYARGEYQGRYDQATHLANTREVALNEALAQRKRARETPIDPSKAFADGAGALAFGAIIGSAIANVGLAWMGQSAQPINVIDNLVERSLRIQREQKAAAIDEASEGVEMSRAEMASAKADARAAADQLLRQKFAEAQTDQERNNISAIQKDNEAKLKQAEYEYAEAIADTVTTSTTHQSAQSSTQTKPGDSGYTIDLPAGSTEEDAQDAINAKRFDAEATDGDKGKLEKLSENAKAISDRARVIKELRQLEQEGGYVSDVTGIWQGGKGAAGAIIPGVSKENLQNPKQQRAAQLLTQLEGLNRMSWKTEPNSKETQERLASLGLPKNDSDIPTFFDRQESEIRDATNSLYTGYDDKVVGKFRTQNRKTKAGSAEKF